MTIISSDGKEPPLKLDPYIISSSDFKTDKDGQVIFLFKTSNSNRAYDVRIQTVDTRYQQAISTFRIDPFDSKEKASIWIDNKKRLSYVVGDRFKSEINSEGNVRSMYL